MVAPMLIVGLGAAFFFGGFAGVMWKMHSDDSDRTEAIRQMMTTTTTGTPPPLGPCTLETTHGTVRLHVEGFGMTRKGYKACENEKCKEVPAVQWSDEAREWLEAANRTEVMCGCGRFLEVWFDLGPHSTKIYKLRASTYDDLPINETQTLKFAVARRVDGIAMGSALTATMGGSLFRASIEERVREREQFPIDERGIRPSTPDHVYSLSTFTHMYGDISVNFTLSVMSLEYSRTKKNDC